MIIRTSYFGNIKNLTGYVSIAAVSPKWYTGAEYKKLAPPVKLLGEYKRKQAQLCLSSYKMSEFDLAKNRLDEIKDWYAANYYSSTLSKISQEQVIRDLEAYANNNIVILLCYEKPGTFCHRNIVAQWLRGHPSVTVIGEIPLIKIRAKS